MRLSKNFTSEELTHTDTGLPNTPDDIQLTNLLYLANYILQPIRDRFGKIRINSAFRSKEVNDVIKGAANSQHLSGAAADIFPEESEFDIVFEWMKSRLIYGQVIKEQKGSKKWIHVSLPRIGGMNMQALLFNDGEYRNA